MKGENEIPWFWAYCCLLFGAAFSSMPYTIPIIAGVFLMCVSLWMVYNICKRNDWI